MSEERTDIPTPEADQVAPQATLRQRLYRVPILGAIVYLIWPQKKASSNWRRAISWTSGVVAILGIGMVAYPWVGDKYPFFYRVPVEKLIEWSNFLSDLDSNRIQDRLEDEFAGIGDIAAAGEGDPITRLEIPKLGVDTIVVQGTGPDALRAGAGHYRQTPLPGEKGNVAIAGHRTTYGRPFNKVDALRTGDRIILTTPLGRYTYELTRDPWITTPYDWSVIEQTEDSLLTLTSCHPKGSARQRIIVQAKLIDSEAIGAGAREAA